MKKVSVAGPQQLRLPDIADIYAPAELMPKLRKIKLLDMRIKKKKNCLLSIIDIINAIDKEVPGHTINNVGEIDTVIEYTPKTGQPNAFWQWSKVAFISLLLLSGSATAIMSFHSDSQMPTVFQNYYKLFFDESRDSTIIIDLPYSIGLAVGIIVFFNHFLGKKITDDPTPIEVEMSLYEGDVTDTMIDLLNTKKEEDSDV
jgi:stage V sporulation protein AA